MEVVPVAFDGQPGAEEFEIEIDDGTAYSVLLANSEVCVQEAALRLLVEDFSKGDGKLFLDRGAAHLSASAAISSPSSPSFRRSADTSASTFSASVFWRLRWSVLPFACASASRMVS